MNRRHLLSHVATAGLMAGLASPAPILSVVDVRASRSDPLLSAYSGPRNLRPALQVPFSCVPSALAEIEQAISQARLNRYMAAANHDKRRRMWRDIHPARVEPEMR